ncbi:MAG: MBOAT family protein [Gemmataceae bacterium]|nr:MBOAT family protein [Gemmataceae bacterium]
MLFCTRQFVLFFALVFVLYWALPWSRARVLLLLVASFLFYAAWNQWLAVIICVSTVLDYLVARGMDASTAPRLRKGLLTLSITANLGLLCYFKYANFFLQSLQEALNTAGLSASFPVLSVLLPLGISFYTFEAISYTVDVYFRRIPAERSLPSFMLFILFFPHLVAGPIVRARDFLPQVRRRKRWSWPRMALGARFVVLGVFKKLAIADPMIKLVDPVFADPGAYSAAALWMAALAYALQVYCDFSGYSDIALGCAHLLGYKLARNFDMPYLARNIAEFWRRWHISLSSWIRDYLFIPLGGSRLGQWITYRNLILTMTLAGLWHGAAWNYVLFGVVQGLMLCAHRSFRAFCEPRPGLSALLASVPGTVLRVAFTFTCFCYSLVIFRSTTLEGAWTMMTRMVTGAVGSVAPLQPRWLLLTVAVVALGHYLGQRTVLNRLSQRVPAELQGMALAVMFTVALVLAPDASKAFVYFQF